jgi:hypothetical protein
VTAPAVSLTAIQAARAGIGRVGSDRLPRGLHTALDDLHAELIASAALLYAFDAAFPAPPSVYKANGAIAANVYVSGNFGQSSAHVNGMRAGGVAPWPNYEVALWELVSNRAAGQAAARRGIADALRCGFPADASIWFPFSVDVNVDPTQYHMVGDAFRGIQDINAGRFLISFYGQGALASYLRSNNIIDQKCWLSASASFHGWNPASPDICIWQQVGNFIPGYSTDRNVITDPYALHAWWLDGSPYAGTTQEGFMATQLSDAQALEIYQVIHFLGDAFEINNSVVLRKQGEFGEALRTLRDNFGHLATGAGVIDAKAQLVAQISALPHPPDVATIVAAVIAALPPAAAVTLTPEQIATVADAVAAALPALALTLTGTATQVTS